MIDNNREIEKYYIAYVDLLGYKDFFENHADRVSDFLKTIQGAIETTKATVSKTNLSTIMSTYADMDVKIKIFSDNILLCLKTGSEKVEIIRLLTFLALIADIQRSFVSEYGLFLRGGITIGEMFINDSFVFGQGLIDSVSMEARANYPRIILSQPIVDFLFQRHYISDYEIQSCADISNKFQLEEKISDQEKTFFATHAPQISNELFSSQWKYALVIEDSDGENILNYLYNLNIKDMVCEAQWEGIMKYINIYFPQDYDTVISDGYNYAEMLQHHKENVKKKLLEYGIYDDIATSDIKSADARERVFKKYLWVMKFHNFVAQKENLLECTINAQVNCDGRFMKMNLGALQ